jgi:hypothetical protein
MRARRIRLDLALALLVAMAVAAAALVHEGTAASSTVTPGSPAPVADAFSRAYLGYLDGSVALAALPDTTSRVRSLGNEQIPPAARSGPIRLTRLQLSHVAGSAQAQALVVGRDRRHEYTVEIDIHFIDGRWQVIYIVPPDLDTILASPARVPAPPSALRLAASRFAVAYVDYREGATHSLPAALPAMRRQIQTGQDPLVAMTPTHAPGRLASLVLGPVADRAVAAHAVVADAGGQVPVEFDLQQTAAGWQAWGFPEGSQ